MDPVSATASIVSIVDVALRATSALVKYTRDTQQASRDKKLLGEEAHFLSKLLERLKSRAQASQDQKWLLDHAEITQKFSESLQELADTLKIDLTTGEAKEESRLSILRNTARWSFTKSEVYGLLQRVERLQQYANALLSDDQHTMLERLDQKQQEALDQKLKTSMLSWLSPLQMAQVHQTISDRAEKGSGRWFISCSAFRTWSAQSDNPLWCWGMPGAGKTVLTSIVVNHLRQERDESKQAKVGVAVLYLKYNDPDQSLDSLLGSLARQLVQEMVALPDSLVELYELHRNRNTTPTIEELSVVLQSIVQSFEQIFFVVDGLDECNEDLRWELLERLEPLQPSIHLLITSRYLDAIAEELERFHCFEVKANREDIEIFIDHQIRKNRNLKRLVQRAPSLRQDIKNAVVKTADNMFLLAQLHVESIACAAGLSVRHVRQKLQSLPTTLTATYDSAMQRIEDQEIDHKKIAFKTLAWISYAFRSLSLRELQHAIAIEPTDTMLDEELLMDGHGITALCAGLLVVDQRTNMVSLVHYSTKDYFENHREKFFPNFHAIITISCATYLTFGALRNLPISFIVQNHPLACYAAQYLGDHARHTPEEELEPSVLETICQLLSHPDNRKRLLSLLDGLDLIRAGFYSSVRSKVSYSDGEPDLSSTFAASMTLVEDTADISAAFDGLSTPRGGAAGRPSLSSQPTESSIDTLSTLETQTNDDNITVRDLWEEKISSSRIPEVTALHLAASMGLAKVASMLLKETPNIDAVDETGKTALTVAMERGFEKAVEFLVNSGACVDLMHEHGRLILLMVLERNWRSAADIIVANARSSLQVDNTSQINREMAFLIATYDSDFEQLEHTAESLHFGALERRTGELALFIAVEMEATEIVRLLLHFGIDINARDSIGQTALFRATRRRCENLIKLLLSSGIEVDSQDDEGKTAWSSNVRSFDRKILDLLLKAGANASTRGLQGVSELYTAATEGETELVKFMLESGTNPSIQTEFQWAPIHWAASYGHIDCLNLLIAGGADVSVTSDQGVTPLDLAIQSNQVASVEILRRAGAKSFAEVQRETSFASPGESDPGWVHIESISGLQIPVKDSRLDLKLLLVFDKPLIRTLVKKTNFGQFIYPRKERDCPALDGFIYQVSHVMETPSSSICVRRAHHRADMHEYPLSLDYFDQSNALYGIQRLRPDNQEFEIASRSQSIVDSILLMHNDWTGSWKIRHRDGRGYKDSSSSSDGYVVRTTPDWSNSSMPEGECRWVTDGGSVLARSGWDDATPNLCFEPGIETCMIDLVVVGWVAKLWAENAVVRKE